MGGNTRKKIQENGKEKHAKKADKEPLIFLIYNVLVCVCGFIFFLDFGLAWYDGVAFNLLNKCIRMFVIPKLYSKLVQGYTIYKSNIMFSSTCFKFASQFIIKL